MAQQDDIKLDPHPSLVKNAFAACDALYSQNTNDALGRLASRRADGHHELSEYVQTDTNVLSTLGQRTSWAFAKYDAGFNTIIIAFLGVFESESFTTPPFEDNPNQLGGTLVAGITHQAQKAIPISALFRWLKKGKKLLFTGHSLGGAIATMAMILLLTHKEFPKHTEYSVDPETVRCVTFGAPFVGDENFQKYTTRMDIEKRLFSYVRQDDPIPEFFNIMSDLCLIEPRRLQHLDRFLANLKMSIENWRNGVLHPTNPSHTLNLCDELDAFPHTANIVTSIGSRLTFRNDGRIWYISGHVADGPITRVYRRDEIGSSMEKHSLASYWERIVQYFPSPSRSVARTKPLSMFSEHRQWTVRATVNTIRPESKDEDVTVLVRFHHDWASLIASCEIVSWRNSENENVRRIPLVCHHLFGQECGADIKIPRREFEAKDVMGNRLFPTNGVAVVRPHTLVESFVAPSVNTLTTLVVAKSIREIRFHSYHPTEIACVTMSIGCGDGPICREVRKNLEAISPEMAEHIEKIRCVLRDQSRSLDPNELERAKNSIEYVTKFSQNVQKNNQTGSERSMMASTAAMTGKSGANVSNFGLGSGAPAAVGGGLVGGALGATEASIGVGIATETAVSVAGTAAAGVATTGAATGAAATGAAATGAAATGAAATGAAATGAAATGAAATGAAATGAAATGVAATGAAAGTAVAGEAAAATTVVAVAETGAAVSLGAVAAGAAIVTASVVGLVSVGSYLYVANHTPTLGNDIDRTERQRWADVIRGKGYEKPFVSEPPSWLEIQEYFHTPERMNRRVSDVPEMTDEKAYLDLGRDVAKAQFFENSWLGYVYFWRDTKKDERSLQDFQKLLMRYEKLMAHTHEIFSILNNKKIIGILGTKSAGKTTLCRMFHHMSNPGDDKDSVFPHAMSIPNGNVIIVDFPHDQLQDWSDHYTQTYSALCDIVVVVFEASGRANQAEAEIYAKLCDAMGENNVIVLFNKCDNVLLVAPESINAQERMIGWVGEEKNNLDDSDDDDEDDYTHRVRTVEEFERWKNVCRMNLSPTWDVSPENVHFVMCRPASNPREFQELFDRQGIRKKPTKKRVAKLCYDTFGVISVLGVPMAIVEHVGLGETDKEVFKNWIAQEGETINVWRQHDEEVAEWYQQGLVQETPEGEEV